MGFEKAGFDAGGVERDGAGRKFGGGCAFVAELAGAVVILRDADGGAEGAAGDRAVLVEFAVPGFNVERGAGMIVEALGQCVLIEELAGCGVAGVVRAQRCDGLARAFSNLFSLFRGELPEAFAKAVDIERGDGEGTQAALGAAGPAGKPGAGALSGFGEPRVEMLDEREVSGHAFPA